MRQQNLLYYKNATLLKNALSFFVQSVLQTSDTVKQAINKFTILSKPTTYISQYAEARWYPPKKRCLGFDFKFKKFSIKQAIFITDIFPSRIKAPKQKKV
jgi:hypothetical protein